MPSKPNQNQNHHHYYFYSLSFFHISISWWFFHWSFSDSKSPQVSSTLLSILADLKQCSSFGQFSTPPIISKSFSPCTNPLVTVPRAPITISIIITFIIIIINIIIYINCEGSSHIFLHARIPVICQFFQC